MQIVISQSGHTAKATNYPALVYRLSITIWPSPTKALPPRKMNCSIRCPIRTQDSPLRWLKSNSGASTVTSSRISPTRTYKRQPFQRLKEMSRCFWSPPTPMRSTGPITLLWYTPIMSWNHASLMRPSQPFRHPGDPICSCMIPLYWRNYPGLAWLTFISPSRCVSQPTTSLLLCSPHSFAALSFGFSVALCQFSVTLLRIDSAPRSFSPNNLHKKKRRKPILSTSTPPFISKESPTHIAHHKNVQQTLRSVCCRIGSRCTGMGWT